MQSIHSKIGTYNQPVYANAKDYNQLDQNIFDHLNQAEADYLPYGNEIIDAIPAEIDMPYLDQLDEYIGTKVVIPGSTPDTAPVLAIVKGRKRDNNGNPVGIKNENPILDTRVYQLEFPDGRVQEYGTNIIVENLMSQIDNDGYDIGFFDEIVDIRKHDGVAIPKGSKGFTSMSGRMKPIITTKGWDFLIKWKDGSTNWLPLSVVKESFPIQCAEFVHARNMQTEPAFFWWSPLVLKKRKKTINKVKTYRAHRKGNMKY